MTMLTGDTPTGTPPADTGVPAGTPPAGTPPADGGTPPADKVPADTGDASAKAEGKAEDAAKPAADAAPEKYEFVKPKGFEGDLDAKVVDEVSALAKELGLTQEKAQKVLDNRVNGAQAQTSAQVDQIKAIHEEWRGLTEADKEIGGEKLAENLATAKAAMQATSTPQLITLLDKSGLGNHPEVIRHFLKIAPAFAEGKHVPGGKEPAGDSKSAAKVLYPNHA